MDAQELRNLQEAYLSVYSELDEGRGDDLRKKHRLEPGKVSKRLSHRADTKTFKYEINDPRRDALSTLSRNAGARSQGDTNLHGSRRRIRRGGRPYGTNIHTDADRDRGDKGERFADFVAGKRNSPNMTDAEKGLAHVGRGNRFREEVDLYDIILSHLLDEGYAETPEAAEVIMVNMSEEWRESIVEANKGDDHVTSSMYGDAQTPTITAKQHRRQNRDFKGLLHPSDWGTQGEPVRQKTHTDRRGKKTRGPRAHVSG